MLLDVMPDEGAVGEDGEAALAGRVEDTGHQRGPDAPTTHGGVHLGVRQRHRAAVYVIARQPDDVVVDPDLEASPLGDVHHLRVHASSPPVPRRRCRSPTYTRHGSPVSVRWGSPLVTSRVGRVFPGLG